MNSKRFGRKVMRYYCLAGLAVMLTMCLGSISYAVETPNVSADSNHAASVLELATMIEEAPCEKDAREIIQETDPSIVQDHYESLQEINNEVTNALINGTIDADNESEIQEVANDIENEFDEVQDVDASVEKYGGGDGASITYSATLENGEIEVVIEDAEESSDLEPEWSDVLTAGNQNTLVKMHKNFDDRYTSIYNKAKFTGYPTAEFKFRIGYTLYRNKTIAGRYINAYKDNPGNYVSGLKITPIEDSLGWDKKKRNNDHIQAHCSYYERFYITGVNALTYKVRIKYRVIPLTWDKTGATVVATGEITSQKIS